MAQVEDETKYYWVCTRDRLAEAESTVKIRSHKGYHCGNATLAGTKPSAHWSVWDADGECYASGMIYGDFDGFEPQDDFFGPSMGTVSTKINGEVL